MALGLALPCCLPQASFPTGGTRCWSRFPSVHVGKHPPQLPVQMSQDSLPTGATSVFSTTPYTLSVTPGPWFSWNTQPHIRALISSPSARDSPQVPSFLSGLPPHLSILAGLPL